MHAGNVHKHGDNGKQIVYAVQISAAPSYIYTVRWKRVTKPYPKREGPYIISIALNVESGTRPTIQGKS